MYDVVCIGSALVDIFIRSDKFQLHQNDQTVLLCQNFGEKIEVDSMLVHTGGGASNTAVGFQRLGFEAGIVAETGRDAFSQLVISELEKEKVETSMMITERKEETGGSVILVSTDGGRTVLVHRGAASQLDVHDIDQTKISSASWLHLSSITGRQEVLKLLFEISRTQNIPISWNPGSAELDLIADGKLKPDDISVKILILNTTEWAKIEAQQAALRSHVAEIVVTDGKQGGSVYLADSPTITYQAQSANAVDDTGAGDAFSVGYVSAHLRDHSPETAVSWGVRNSASVVEHFGAKAGLLRQSEFAHSES